MEIRWRRNIVSALLLLFGICAVIFGSFKREEVSAGSASEKMETVKEETLRSCVRIQAKGHYGSGSIFAIDDNKITVVTNKHVLQYWDEDSYVTFFNGVEGRGQVVTLSNQADVGVLCVDVDGLSADELSRLSVVETSDRSLKQGEWFFMPDMASDVWNPVFYQGQVLEPLVYLEDFGMEMIYGDSAFQAGMSGSGVFDVDGKYIGMLTGGTDQNEVAAVPLQIIINLCRKI